MELALLEDKKIFENQKRVAKHLHWSKKDLKSKPSCDFDSMFDEIEVRIDSKSKSADDFIETRYKKL